MSVTQPDLMQAPTNDSTEPVATQPAPRLPMIRAPRRIVLYAGLSAVIFDWFFVGNQLGISLPLFTGLLTIGFFYIQWREEDGARLGNIGLLLPAIFFAAMAAWRSNGLLTALNVAATLALFTYLTYTYAGNRLARTGFLGYGLIPLRAWTEAFVQGAQLLSDAIQQVRANSQRRHLWALLRGLMLAGPLLLIFGALLAAADALFANILANTFSFFELARLPEYFLRLLLIGLISWVLSGLVAFALTVGRDEAPVQLLSRFSLAFLGHVEAMTILLLVDILFASFVAVQFGYLFRPVQRIFDEEIGMTFSEAARRGFFELVVVACLSLALIIGLHWLARRETKGQLRAFNAAASFMIGMVLVILVSAFYRLFLYELTYGFTQLRLYSHLFIICLAGLLVWTIVVLWARPQGFASGVFATAFIFVGLLNLVNPDGFIARQNILRYQGSDSAFLSNVMNRYADSALDGRVSQNLDTTYLISLPDDAIPTLVKLYDQLPAAEQAAIHQELTRRLDWFTVEWPEQPWQSLHLGRLLAYRALQQWAAGS